MPRHRIWISLRIFTTLIHFMVHRTIWCNIAKHMMLPRHKQAQDNDIQFLGSYIPIWCGWKPTAQAILPQWHMHPQHLHIGLICQAIPLEFHCCYSLIWYISLSTEHSSATQDSPPTLSSYGRKSNSSLPIQCCRSDSDSSPSASGIKALFTIHAYWNLWLDQPNGYCRIEDSMPPS